MVKAKNMLKINIFTITKAKPSSGQWVVSFIWLVGLSTLYKKRREEKWCVTIVGMGW